MYYKRKPGLYEAFRFGYDTEPQWFIDAVSVLDIDWISNECCYVNTEYGQRMVNIGDYIVKDLSNHYDVYTSNSFEKHFKPDEII